LQLFLPDGEGKVRKLRLKQRDTTYRNSTLCVISKTYIFQAGKTQETPEMFNAVYTKELREEAVKLVTEKGLTIPDVGRRLSIPKSTIKA
jgi:hypothetical protein